jgi:FG-GAP repeat
MTAPLVTAPPASPSQPTGGQRPRRTRRKPVHLPMDLGIPAPLRRPRRRAIAILLLTGLLLVLVWPLPAFAASSRATGAAASRVALRADFNGDGNVDLAIGAQGENDFAGVVHVLYGAPTGLTATGSQLWSQDSPGIAGGAEAFDFFGAALAASALRTPR